MSGAIGLDLSLTSTGLSDGYTVTTIKPTGDTGIERLRWIRRQITSQVAIVGPDIICVEGPSYGSKGGHEHERGGLWWIVVDWLGLYAPIVAVPPTTLKKFATGKGNANKDAMIVATCRRFDWFNGNNDEADALWLAAMGLHHLGKPVVDLPALNLTALTGVVWPEPAAA